MSKLELLELSNVDVETVSRGLLVRSNVSVEEGTYRVTLTPVEPEPKPEPVAPPSWDDAPYWAQWLAQDASGMFRWYVDRPVPDLWGSGGAWDAQGATSNTCRSITRRPPNPNWRDTLQQRPAPEPLCPVCGKPASEHRDGLFCCGHCGREVHMYLTTERGSLLARDFTSSEVNRFLSRNAAPQ